MKNGMKCFHSGLADVAFYYCQRKRCYPNRCFGIFPKKKESSGGLGLFAFLVIFVILIIATRSRILEWLFWLTIFSGRGGGHWGGKITVLG